MTVKIFTYVIILLSFALLISEPGLAFEQNDKPNLGSDNDDTVAVSDSLKKENLEEKEQIENSPPNNISTTKIPPTGKVLSTKEKVEAQRESVAIIRQNPDDRKTMPAKNPDGTPTIALALGGGGARGAAHIGVLKVLEAEHIKANEIVGNSMGAIVGGLYCSGVSLDRIESEMKELRVNKAYAPGGPPKKLMSFPLQIIVHRIFPKHYAGIWSGERFTKYLDSILPQPNMEVEDTIIPFSAVATNLLDGKAYRITHGRLSTAIKASSALSPIVRPVAMGDKLFIDGGIRANLPASAAKDTGAGLVIAVLVDEPLRMVPAKRFLKIKNIASRITDIVAATADERQLQFADIVINPDVSNIGILSNNPKDIERAIAAGEAAAKKALPELRKRLKLPAKTLKST